MELEDEIDLHKRGWVIQRVGWALLFLVFAASLFGLFGHGILSNKKFSKRGVQIEYERFTRMESPSEFRITINNVAHRRLSVTLSCTYLEKMRITAIQPEPQSQVVSKKGIEYTFNLPDGAVIQLFLEPQRPGNTIGDVEINGVTFNVSQYIYP